MNHEKTSLGEILTLERRPVKLEIDKEYSEIGIYSYGRGIFHKPPRTGSEIGDKKLFEIKEGDFILQVTFAWEGAVALASSKENGKCGSVRFLTFSVNKEKCNPEYLLYYFHTTMGLENLIRISPGSAGRNRVLNVKRIPEIMISLPSIKEQLQIVSRIKQLKEKIAYLHMLKEQSIELIDNLTDSIFENILKVRSKNPNWNSGLLPLFSKINPSRKGNTKYSENYPVSFVPMMAVSDHKGTIEKQIVRPYSEVSKGYTWFEENDVIFARITPCMENGKSAVARGLKNRVGFGSTEFHVIRAGPDIHPEWIHAILRRKKLRDAAALSFKGTAGQQRVPNSFLENLTIPVPSLPEQEEILTYLNKIQNHVLATKTLQAKTIQTVESLFKSFVEKIYAQEKSVKQPLQNAIEQNLAVQ